MRILALIQFVLVIAFLGYQYGYYKAEKQHHSAIVSYELTQQEGK